MNTYWQVNNNPLKFDKSSVSWNKSDPSDKLEDYGSFKILEEKIESFTAIDLVRYMLTLHFS